MAETTTTTAPAPAPAPATPAPAAPAPAVPAPTEAPAPTPAAAPAVAPKTPSSIGEVRRGLRSNVTTEVPAAPERDASGRFASPEAEAEPAVEPAIETSEDASTEAEPVSTEGLDATTTETPDTPAEPVVIDVPEGHPLRDQGIETLPPIPAEFENAFRALLNYPVRRAELSQAHEQVTQGQRQVAEQKAEADFWFEKAQFFASNPQLAMQVSQMKEEHGDDAARRYVAGVLQEDIHSLQQRVQEAGQNSESETLRLQAQTFVNGARPALAQRYPDLALPQINQLIDSYGQRIKMGIYDTPHADSLFQYASEVLGAPKAPAVQETNEDMEVRLRAQIQSEMAAAAAQTAQEHQRKALTNPMGRVAGTSSVRQSGVAAPTGDETPQPMTAMEARRALRSHRPR